MPTAACGINCDVCRLNLLGQCSTCGPGKSREGLRKMEAQLRILGAPCPILACAIDKGVAYCLRDCHLFPCRLYESGPYPFSQAYLRMQKRRRQEEPPAKTPLGDVLKVPTEYWDELSKRDTETVCKNALAKCHSPTGVILPFLTEYFLIDTADRSLCFLSHGSWQRTDHPLLTLLCLVYLLNVGPEPLKEEMISVQELKSGHFFQGPHELRVSPLLKRYGNDVEAFKKSATYWGGVPLTLADVAFRMPAFPKVPIYYLLWMGDEEFEPSLSILFDRSIESHLSADAIWGIGNFVSDILLRGDQARAPWEQKEHQDRS